MKPSPIKIGIPVNSRLQEDCSPVADFLEFKKSLYGVIQSRFVPNALFYPLRVRTIAKYVRERTLDLGILGEDTAIDEDLEYSVLKCFSLNKLPATALCLLMRKEDAAQNRSFNEILTSYPKATKKILDPKCPVITEEGQIEFQLRNFGDRFGAAVDIVRSGQTTKKFGLVAVTTLLQSRPGLWKVQYPSQQINDTENSIRERLLPLINI